MRKTKMSFSKRKIDVLPHIYILANDSALGRNITQMKGAYDSHTNNLFDPQAVICRIPDTTKPTTHNTAQTDQETFR